MVGSEFGKYRVLEKLGEGGMGTVWKAHDRVLDRFVALKLLPERALSSPSSRRRILREAKSASRLDHPCIATIYESGEFEGRVYLALAYVDGETVLDRLERGPMPVEEAVRIAASVTGALAHAHDRGVIHRDVSARNVMIARDGRVRVLDFGLALREGQSRSTRTGQLFGTLAYLAPEVASGRSADRRSDLYSLGALLYEMLTGAPPFPSERPEAALVALLQREPEPPSALRDGLPPELDRLVLRILDKDPARRPADARALLDELRRAAPEGVDRLGEGEGPGSARSGGTRGGGAGSPAERVIAVTPFRDLSYGSDTPADAAAFARGLAEAVSAGLARLGDIQVVPPGASPEVGDEVEEPAQLARRLGADLLLTGSVQSSGSRLRVTFSLRDPFEGVLLAGDRIDGSVREVFDVQDRLTERVAGALRLERGATAPARRRTPLHDTAAHQHYLQALGYLQRYENEASVDGAIKLLEELIRERPDSATFEAALARAYLFKYRLTSRAVWESRAAETCERALHLDPRSADVHLTLGELHLEVGRPEEAISDLQRSLEMRPRNPDAYLALARAFEAEGELASAEKASRKAIELRPRAWSGHNLLGWLLFQQGRYEEAAETWRTLVEQWPENARGFANLGASYFRLGDFLRAIEAYHRSLEIQPNANAYSNLGTAHFFQAHYVEAAAMFEKAAALKEDDARVWGNLGDAYRWTTGAESDASEAFERAIQLMRVRVELNPRAYEDRAWLAEWLAKLGRKEEARREIERALEGGVDEPICAARAVVVYELVGCRQEAIRLLERAVSLGYGTVELDRDPELRALREDSRYRPIVLAGAGDENAVQERTVHHPTPGR